MWSSIQLALALCAVTPSTQVEEFLGPEAMEVLQSVAQMEILELAPGMPGPDQLPADAVRAVNTRHEIQTAQAQRLAEIFLRHGTYRFSRSKACAVEPTVALRFRNLTHVLDLLLRFKCSTFTMVLQDAAGRVLLRKSEDFDGSRKELRRRVAQALSRPPSRVLTAFGVVSPSTRRTRGSAAGVQSPPAAP